jgi:uncharacterized YigZ family protein
VSSGADPDRYAAVDDGPEVEHRVLGSRFLGRAFRVTAHEDAMRRLRAVARTHHAATHHAWASRIGAPGAVVERSDDAGEPSGTAGRPILDRLRRRDVHGCLVVVTRYFGGTKLGTGGLARAYGDAAGRALDAAPVRPAIVSVSIRAACAFDDAGAVEAVLHRAAADVLGVERAWDPAPAFRIRVRRSRAEALAAALVDSSAGRCRVAVEPETEVEP